MFPRILVRVTEWVKAHKQFGLEFEECGSHTWVFLRTWREEDFYLEAVGVVDRFYGNASSELVFFGQVLCAIGSGASLVSISGGSNTPVECYDEYIWSGYIQGLLDYPVFDARMLRRGLQKSASAVFGTLDPFLRTEIIVIYLRGAEYREWMQSRQFLRRAIETGDLCLRGLVDVVSNIIGVWPLIVSHLKETAKKDSDVSLVVYLFLVASVLA